MVVKKDHSREVFDRQKLLNGMLRACEKRPVSYQQLDEAVSRIEQQLLNSYDREVTSIHIGDLAMQELKKMDDVAYVRFASVYRQFSDVNTFMKNSRICWIPAQSRPKNDNRICRACSRARAVSTARSERFSSVA